VQPEENMPFLFSLRYTLRNVKPLFLTLLTLLASSLAFAQDKSFNTVKLPNAKGKLIKSVLTFKDSDKAVEIRPIKGDAVTIPYAQIDRWAY
jgi:hypothetical protein